MAAIENGALAVDFDLVNTLTGVRLATQRFTGPPGALRNAAHRVSDAVYQKILGVRGAFATRIANISVEGTAHAQRHRLELCAATMHACAKVAGTFASLDFHHLVPRKGRILRLPRAAVAIAARIAHHARAVDRVVEARMRVAMYP